MIRILIGWATGLHFPAQFSARPSSVHGFACFRWDSSNFPDVQTLALISVDLCEGIFHRCQRKRSVSLNIPFPVSKFDLPAGSSQKYRLYEQFFLTLSTFYAICVDSRFYFPWRNTTLWDWDEELFRFKFREVWKFRFAARVYMFYACWFSLPNQNAFSSLSRSSNYFEKLFLIHSGGFR